MTTDKRCKHCGKPATILISRPSPFSPQYPLCEGCGNDEVICNYYAHEQHKYKSIEQFTKDTGWQLTTDDEGKSG